MKRRTRDLLAGLAVLLALAACGDDTRQPAALDTPGDAPDTPVEFPVSRSTTGGVQDEELKTVFTNGTEIGICVEGYDEYANVKYKYQDGKFVPAELGKGIYFSQGSEEEMMQTTYTAYYPYQEDAKKYANPTVKEEQTNDVDYYTSDALITTGRLGNPMKFEHRMAKLFITTNRPVDDITVLDLQSTADTPKMYAWANKANNEGTQWRAVFAPGTHNIKMSVLKNGQTYLTDFGEKTLEAGRQYTYTINALPNLDLSKGDVILSEPGEYTVTQSAGGTAKHSLKIETGGDVTVHLQNVNISAPTAIYATNSGTATLVLDTNTTVVSTDAGQPGICIGSDVTLKIEGNGHELRATGGNPFTYIPGAPAIGVTCDNNGTNNNLVINNCVFHGNAKNYAAVIGNCGDVPRKNEERYSRIGNITIKNSTLYLKTTMASPVEHIGNGRISSNTQYGKQHLSVGVVTLEGCTFEEPKLNNLRIGKKRGTQSNGSYEIKGVIIDGVSYENGYPEDVP